MYSAYHVWFIHCDCTVDTMMCQSTYTIFIFNGITLSVIGEMFENFHMCAHCPCNFIISQEINFPKKKNDNPIRFFFPRCEVRLVYKILWFFDNYFLFPESWSTASDKDVIIVWNEKKYRQTHNIFQIFFFPVTSFFFFSFFVHVILLVTLCV